MKLLIINLFLLVASSCLVDNFTATKNNEQQPTKSEEEKQTLVFDSRRFESSEENVLGYTLKNLRERFVRDKELWYPVYDVVVLAHQNTSCFTASVKIIFYLFDKIQNNYYLDNSAILKKEPAIDTECLNYRK